jgi:hypothetical protein
MNRAQDFALSQEIPGPIIQMQRITTFLLLCAVLACTKNPSAGDLLDNAVHAITSADTIRTFITEADCVGPQGTYSTLVHSGPDYTYFKQTYSYSGHPFEAVIIKDSAFQLVNDSISDALDDKEIIGALKSHEFHMILIDLKERFHQFSVPEYLSNQIKIDALDELNNPIAIYIGKDSPEIQSITMRNPGDTTEIISFLYSDWKVNQGVRLPMHVTIRQGKDKTFTFDFTKVEINSKDFKRWKE